MLKLLLTLLLGAAVFTAADDSSTTESPPPPEVPVDSTGEAAPASGDGPSTRFLPSAFGANPVNNLGTAGSNPALGGGNSVFGGLNPGFGGFNPGFGGGFNPGFGGGFNPGFGGGFNPGFGGGFNPGFGGGFNPGFGGGFNPGFGGGFNPGFGGFNPAFAQGNRPFTTGCRRWCRTPEGQRYCCEGADQPDQDIIAPGSSQIVKPGFCPPVRPICPNTRSFPPITCSNDGACFGPIDKCCFDRCLNEHVCKPPSGFGR